MSNELKFTARVQKHQAARWFGLSRFDLTVWAVIAAFLVATALTVLIGDRVGARVLSAGPIDSAHSTSQIFFQFSEDMNRPNVEQHFATPQPRRGKDKWTFGMVCVHRRRPLSAAR